MQDQSDSETPPNAPSGKTLISAITPVEKGEKAPTIVIVGRPNVGKSSIFNRLFGRKRALVHDMPGVTRDRLEEKTEWVVRAKTYAFNVIDTGGLGGETFAVEIERQVQIALTKADIVLWVVDGKLGVVPQDEEISSLLIRSGLRKKGVPVYILVNKLDDHQKLEMSTLSEFYEYSENLFPLSAEHALGFEDLKEAVVADLTKREVLRPILVEEPVLEHPRIAIVGKPNVGKSTLVNALLREERMIVSDVAGTTIDSIDSECTIDGFRFTLIDTAGIRRKNKTEQGVEVLSVIQTKKALERCNVAFLVLDGEEGLVDQDERLAGLIEEVGCSVVLIMNKWDTQKKNTVFTKEEAAKSIREKIPFLKYAPILFLSAKERTGFKHMGDLVQDILEQRKVKIPTHELTEWIRAKSEVHNPKNVKFFLCHHAGKNPPTFVCHVSQPENVETALERHFMNAMREEWGFMGTPIRFHFVAKKVQKLKRKNDRSLKAKADARRESSTRNQKA
jgi:GTPase